MSLLSRKTTPRSLSQYFKHWIIIINCKNVDGFVVCDPERAFLPPKVNLRTFSTHSVCTRCREIERTCQKSPNPTSTMRPRRTTSRFNTTSLEASLSGFDNYIAMKIHIKVELTRTRASQNHATPLFPSKTKQQGGNSPAIQSKGIVRYQDQRNLQLPATTPLLHASRMLHE